MTDLVKPLRRRVTATKIAHGYRNRLVITLHPNAVLEIREAHSRQAPVILDLATLYVQATIKAAMERARAKKRGKP